MKAATDWILFSQDDHLAPRIGEWCLWSIVTDKGRENYSGTRMGEVEIYLEGFPRRIVSIDENTYWARVYLMPHVKVVISQGKDNDA